MKPSIMMVLCAGSLALQVILYGCARQPEQTAGEPGGEQSSPPAATDDPHDVPLTEAEIDQLRDDVQSYAAAIDHIKQFRDVIRRETTEGDAAAAHRSLDKLDLVLQWMPEIVQNSGIEREHWQTIGENAQRLRDLFDQIHARIDEGAEPDYAAVAEEIDQSIQQLESIPADMSDDEPGEN